MLKKYNVTLKHGVFVEHVVQAARSAEEAIDRAAEALKIPYGQLDEGSAMPVNAENKSAASFVDRFSAALLEHGEKDCPACHAFERDREERGVRG